ncbi:hypothetical protein COZ78_03660 [bacterium (Candidatus Gribaldobacteria) CG_4_8_14_3_um_filter_42_11]|uniref:Uncharacterized protein n=1 Tax=bacterium (Candidatus Gribaldobacteria) CG_4_8_14_3_um_filter_42_11 TaxID=2014267 RepID=A0A2M7IXC8_9BACT|nr:MAG: hypothetical protein COZ78_03660 [bacterium (Candidatus Gribaldobacteria) CG_4_8_14_3_um_filter_42_11]
MTLSEIAELVGEQVVNLSPKSIERAVEAGMISRKQGEGLLTELNKADGIWENPMPGVACAERLW